MKFFFFFLKKNNNVKEIINNNNYIIKFNKIKYCHINQKNNFNIFYKINKNSFFKSTNLFFKNGLLLKFFSNFCIYCFNFYLNLFNLKNLKFYNNGNNDNNNFFFNLYKYKYFDEIKILINNNFFFKNPIILFNWYFLYFNFLISVKFLYNSTLKLKKKNNKRYITQVFFIKKSKRINFFFKWLKYLFILNYRKNFKNSLNYLFNDIFFNFKNSQLYKYKIFLYNFFLYN